MTPTWAHRSPVPGPDLAGRDSRVGLLHGFHTGIGLFNPHPERRALWVIKPRPRDIRPPAQGHAAGCTELGANPAPTGGAPPARLRVSRCPGPAGAPGAFAGLPGPSVSGLRPPSCALVPPPPEACPGCRTRPLPVPPRARPHGRLPMPNATPEVAFCHNYSSRFKPEA